MSGWLLAGLLILTGLIGYVRDLLSPLWTAVRSWWHDLNTARGRLKFILFDAPIALALIYWQPFIAAGLLAAWVGLTSRRMRPLEAAAVSVMSLALGIWLMNFAAEAMIVLVTISVRDGRQLLSANWDRRNKESGVPKEHPVSVFARFLGCGVGAA